MSLRLPWSVFHALFPSPHTHANLGDIPDELALRKTSHVLCSYPYPVGFDDSIICEAYSLIDCSLSYSSSWFFTRHTMVFSCGPCSVAGVGKLTEIDSVKPRNLHLRQKDPGGTANQAACLFAGG